MSSSSSSLHVSPLIAQLKRLNHQEDWSPDKIRKIDQGADFRAYLRQCEAEERRNDLREKLKASILKKKARPGSV